MIISVLINEIEVSNAYSMPKSKHITFFFNI